MSWILIGTDSVDVSNTSTTVIVSISVVDGVGSAAIVVGDVDTSTLVVACWLFKEPI